MAMSIQTEQQNERHFPKRRRGRTLRPVSEINVTPFVDVMLVLLIIFMVAAPLLTVGVPIDLPETEADALNANTRPITVSVNAEGQIFIQETQIEIDEVIPKLKVTPTAEKAFSNERTCRYFQG